MKKYFFILSTAACLFSFEKLLGQDLTINTSGQTGTSGTNWSTSGTNPVTLQFTGVATVHPSVIEGYLNAGKSVIIQPDNGTWHVRVDAPIAKTSGGDATLTIKSNSRILTNSISSTSNKLDVIIWGEADGGTSFGPAVGSINTNGGHVWIGGGSGSVIWNGLTVGNGVAYSDGSWNWNGVDILGNITTAGGDIYIASDDRNATNLGDIAAWDADRTLNAGSGDIVLLTESADFSTEQNRKLTLITTGTITIAPPNTDNNWVNLDDASFDFVGSMSGNDFIGSTATNSNINSLIIANISALGGLSIGRYTGTGLAGDTPIPSITVSKTVQLSSALSIAGPILLYGASIVLNENIATTNGSTINIIGNALNIGSGKTITTSGSLLISPQTSTNTIGIGGAAGSLQIPASYFTTHFTNGTSMIMIGSDTQSGNIAVNTLTLQDNLTFKTSGNLTLGGTVELGNNDVTISNVLNIIGAPTYYFKTNGSGSLKRTVNNNSSVDFPVGNSTFNAVTIANNSGAADLFSARVVDAVYVNGISGTTVNTPRVDRTWHILKASGPATGSGVSFTFSWDASQEMGNITTFKLNQQNGSGWDLATGSSAIAVGSTTKTMTHTNYTGTLSAFAIGDSYGVLPLTWLKFSGVQSTRGIELQWTTTNDQKNNVFEIQKSMDGIVFTTIARKYVTTTQSINHSYTYVDATSTEGAAFYRIKQIDLDGKYSFSKQIHLQGNYSDAISIGCTPGNPIINIHLSSNTEQIVQAHIVDAMGRNVGIQKLQTGNNQMDASKWSTGIYVIRIIENKRLIYSKTIIQ